MSEQLHGIKKYVEERKKQLAESITQLSKKPLLYIIRVGNDPASVRYTNNKMKDAEEVGIECVLMELPEDISEGALLETMGALNRAEKVDGYIVQLPLPKHISEEKIKLAIDPNKDVDGFHPLSKTVPATPLGIYNFLLLEGTQFGGDPLKQWYRGLNAVVIGRSTIVGRPMAKLLLDLDMNVTILHSKTEEADKKLYIKNADVIVVATGHRGTLTKDYEFKSSALVFDVGINFDENGKLCGDCDKDLPVDYQSPVPGGVGLLTRLSVLENVVKLTKEHLHEN